METKQSTVEIVNDDDDDNTVVLLKGSLGCFAEREFENSATFMSTMNEKLGGETDGNNCDDEIRIPEIWHTELVTMTKIEDNVEPIENHVNSIQNNGRRETAGDLITELHIGTSDRTSTSTDKFLSRTAKQYRHKKSSKQSVETDDSLGAAGDLLVSASILDKTSSSFPLQDAVLTAATSRGDDKKDEFSDDDDGAHISAPSSTIKFLPLQPLQETKHAPQPTRRLRSHARMNTAPFVPNASIQLAGHDSSRASSAAASPENSFINNMVDPVAGTASVPPPAATLARSLYLQHTPSSNIASSYDISHCGKRPRSGVSILGNSGAVAIAVVLTVSLSVPLLAESFGASTSIFGT
jgi:hypothetical protein